MNRPSVRHADLFGRIRDRRRAMPRSCIPSGSRRRCDGVLQVSVLIVAWIHGCIGMYQWLRLKSMFGRWMPMACSAVRTAAGACADGLLPGWTHNAPAGAGPRMARDDLNPWQIGTPQDNHQLLGLAGPGYIGTAIALPALVLLARLVQAWRERHGAAIRVTYPQGTVGESAARLQRAGCKPECRHTTCQYLWRPAAHSHYLPHSCHNGADKVPAPSVAKERPRCWSRCRRPVGSAGLPGAASERSSASRHLYCRPTRPGTALRRREWPLPGEGGSSSCW